MLLEEGERSSLVKILVQKWALDDRGFSLTAGGANTE